MDAAKESGNESAAESKPVAPTAAAKSGLKSGWFSDAAMTAMIAVVVSITAGFVIERRVETKIEQALMARPDIAVVDDLGLVRLAISNGANRYDPAQVSSEIERLVEGAGLGDTILLSQSMVIYSPPGAEIDVAAPKLRDESPRREIGP